MSQFYTVPFSQDSGTFDDFPSHVFGVAGQIVLSQASYVEEGSPRFFYQIEMHVAQSVIGKASVMIQALKGIPPSRQDSDLEIAASPGDVEAFQVAVESLPSWAAHENANEEMAVFQPTRLAFMVSARFDPDLYERVITDLHTSLLAGESLTEAKGRVASALEGSNAEIVDFVKK